MQIFKESNKDWSTIESYTLGRIHCYTYTVSHNDINTIEMLPPLYTVVF